MKTNKTNKTTIPFTPKLQRGEHYEADALVFNCFDWRFNGVPEALGRHFGWKNTVDAPALAGGAKHLAAPKGTPERAVSEAQLVKSVALHKAKAAVLVVHEDCGDSGGSKAFESREAEKDFCAKTLAAAMAAAREVLPADVRVIGAIPGFGEIELVEL